jgi:hypothetical protein
MVKLRQSGWARIASAAVVCVLAAGCGGSGSDGATGGMGADGAALTDGQVSSRVYTAAVATVGGGSRIQPADNAAGGVVVGWLNEIGAFAEFTIDGGTGGTGRIVLRFANGNADARNVTLYVNGARVSQLELPSTGGWTTFVDSAPISVPLGAGPNRVRFQREASDRPSADINQLTVFAPATLPAPQDAPATPLPPPTSAASITAVDRASIPRAGASSANRDIRVTGEMPGGSDVGAFRTVCTFSHFNFDDPLVFPGQQNATHLHMFFGNTATSFASTPESIATTGGSSCRGGIVNRSAYWAPALIDTRNGTPMVPFQIHVYYKSGYYGVRPADVRAWPEGFRMIAGNSRSTAGQPGVVWYRCNGGPNQSFIPQCSGTLSMAVRFQQCWDGRNLDSPDHMSHVRHPRAGEGCNRPGEVATPELSVHIEYTVNAGVNYRLSSDVAGAPAGSSGHADWVKGWEPEVMQTFVTRVINPSRDGGSHMVGDGRVLRCGYAGCS